MNRLASLSPLLRCALVSVSFFAVGCGDPLKNVSLIEETRVLGARVEVEQDPTRSSPQPGENAALRLFLAAPSGAPNVAYELSLCAVSPTNLGFPSCRAAPFAVTVQTEPSAGVPELAFQIPTDLDLDATPHAFATGLICPESALRLRADNAASASDAARCADGHGLEMAFEFDLGGPEVMNHSPTFESDALTLDGEAWLATDATNPACPGELHEVRGGTTHQLGIALSELDFEALPQRTAVDPGRETVLVSQFADAGRLKHAFSSFDAGTAAEGRRVAWDAPTLVDDLPRLVRFYFVARDARGGEDFATRALCVVP